MVSTQTLAPTSFHSSIRQQESSLPRPLNKEIIYSSKILPTSFILYHNRKAKQDSLCSNHIRTYLLLKCKYRHPINKQPSRCNIPLTIIVTKGTYKAVSSVTIEESKRILNSQPSHHILNSQDNSNKLRLGSSSSSSSNSSTTK